MPLTQLKKLPKTSPTPKGASPTIYKGAPKEPLRGHNPTVVSCWFEKMNDSTRARITIPETPEKILIRQSLIHDCAEGKPSIDEAIPQPKPNPPALKELFLRLAFFHGDARNSVFSPFLETKPPLESILTKDVGEKIK